MRARCESKYHEEMLMALKAACSPTEVLTWSIRTNAKLASLKKKNENKTIRSESTRVERAEIFSR